jgi:ABC-type glycerol-3-phosphate transport system substrate-binding protein
MRIINKEEKMKKLLLSIFAILVAAFMVISLSFIGCQATTETAAETEAAEETTAAAETEAAEETTAAAETEAAEPVNLVFWEFGNYAMSALEEGLPQEEWYISKAISRFEAEYPGVTVELSYQPGEKGAELLTAAAMAKEGPDVVSMWGGQYVKDISDSLLDLREYFTQEEIDAVMGWEHHAIGDKYFGAPVRSDTTCILINKALFAQAGIDPETDYDGTLDGLIAMCEEFKSQGITPLIGGVSDGWGLSFIEGSIYVSQLGPGKSEEVLGEILAGERDFVSTPEIVAAYQANQDLYASGYYNEDAPTIPQSEADTLFISGAGAMKPHNASNLLIFINGMGDDLDIIQMPALEADSAGFGTTIGSIGTNAICATNYGEYPVESTNFIRFLRTFEEEQEYIKDTGGLPSVKGEFTGLNPIYNKINITKVVDFLDNLMPPGVSATWWKLEGQMLAGQITVDEFLEAMDTARDEALAISE